MLDTRVVDDHAAVKMRVAEASVVPFATPTGTPLVAASIDLSLARSSRKTRLKSTESEEMLTMSFQLMGLLIWTPLLLRM